MATFPIIFPAPSDAAMAFVSSGKRLDFISTWRREAEVVVGGFRVIPSLPLCMEMYDAVAASLPPVAVAILNTAEARTSCAVNLRGETDPTNIPARLRKAGLR